MLTYIQSLIWGAPKGPVLGSIQVDAVPRPQPPEISVPAPVPVPQAGRHLRDVRDFDEVSRHVASKSALVAEDVIVVVDSSSQEDMWVNLRPSNYPKARVIILHDSYLSEGSIAWRFTGVHWFVSGSTKAFRGHREFTKLSDSQAARLDRALTGK